MFWGPLPPPNTQLAVVQSLADKWAAFRFLAKGIVVDVNQAAQIVKKSKRIGTPCKIFRKTALIKNMFRSDLEIANFKDAKIQTVSGIHGKIVEPAEEDLIDGPREGISKCIFTHKIRRCDNILMNVYEQVLVRTFRATHLPVSAEYEPLIPFMNDEGHKLFYRSIFMKTSNERDEVSAAWEEWTRKRELEEEAD